MTNKRRELALTYEPSLIETKWYKFWLENDYFHAKLDFEKPPFSIILPPPNVTGSLHMGHALTATIQDLLIRWKRMQGYNTLWLPGLDHAGIATQMVVERALHKQGITRYQLGREKFLELVWDWKEKYANRIREQHMRLGASLDWKRERFTMDEHASRAVIEVFVSLYEEGLIYRAKRLINWCPACRSALSDLEVDREEPEKGEMYSFAYPLCDGTGEIVVATTRPETMLGDTAVAVHPQDPRYKHLIGKMVKHPFQNRSLPIIADEILADPTMGTGAVKVTPAHDPEDFECGLRHNLEMINILNPDGSINENGYPFQGLDRFEARKKVKERLKEMGLERGSIEHWYAPGRCYRHPDTIVEPFLSTQWFVKSKPLAIPAIEAVKNGETVIIPEEWTKVYFHWLENVKDWCISRQLWWGHRIPAWYCNSCDKITVRRATPERCSHCGSKDIYQDEDVLDTWFSSALWPFVTLGWPDQTKELELFYPTSIMETGYDILFFWVARMMMMGIHFTGKVPFKKVVLHAMVRDEHGRKMSKATGNVIDPLDLIDGITLEGLIEKVKSYNLPPKEEKQAIENTKKNFPNGIPSLGCDPLRFTLAAYTAQSRDINLSLKRIEGYKKFCNKIWQLVRGVVLPNLDGFVPPKILPKPIYFEDRWIMSRLYSLIDTVEKGYEEFKIYEITSGIYQFLWHELCDWYVEIIKQRLYKGEGECLEHARIFLYHTVEVSLRLLHPIMPFITEELWQALPRKEGFPESIMISPYPTLKDGIKDELVESQFDILKDTIVTIRSIKADYNIPPNKIVPVELFSEEEGVREFLNIHKDKIQLLAKVEYIVIEDRFNPPKGSVLGVTSKVSIAIPLKGIIDIEAEKERLRKELTQVLKEIASVEKKLDNQAFLNRAPVEVIEKHRKIYEELKDKEQKLKQSLNRLEELNDKERI